MFGLFGKKEKQTPEERLEGLRRKQDWAGLARACYELGTAAMDQGLPDRAVLWLHRADTIYSADDRVYDKVGQRITDDCSDRIGALEEADLLYNTLPAQVEERAEALNDQQVRIWGLLSMARLVRLGDRLSGLPGCGVLGELGWALDLMLRSLHDAPTQEEYQRLMGLCDGLYALGDSPAFYGGGEIEVPGGAPFQVFDLNGSGVLLELNGLLDSHLRLLAALSQGEREDLPSAESGAAACALLPDYYVRTGAGSLEEVPQIKAELARIWSDWDFVRSGLTWEQVTQRAESYKTLDILAP